VYWGSCKRACKAQNPFNLLAHVVSFFNNRGYASHYLFGYKHIFLFLSPDVTKEVHQDLETSVKRLNNMLKNPDQIIENARNQLSNVFGHGKKFEPKNMPNQLFEVAECRVYQLIDLV
jgi:hypothetical protein